MTNRLLVTALVFLVAGMLPPLVTALVFRARFIGGIWFGIVVGLVASFSGGLLDTFLLGSTPDLIPIGGVVDGAPPLVLAIVATTLFALVSRSNTG